MCTKQSWRVGLLLAGVVSTAAFGQESEPMELSIVTYDAAHVGSKTLENAERVAGTVLLTAKIQSRWEPGEQQDVANLGLDFTAYSATECQPETTSVVRVQILPRAPVGLSPNALGFSLPCARSGFQVTVYADRVSNVSETGGPTFGRVLGYAMGHELGHVLLKSSRHTAAGLMKGIWSKSDWQRAAVGVVSFSPAETREIAALHKQTAAKNGIQLASLNER